MFDLKIIKSKLPILIVGEPGVGKSYTAKKIHHKSDRFSFFTYHVGSIKSEFIESDLFGHVKGAFTGACEDKKGFCEITGDGTLFIDEIGELKLDLQVKLLELLEERTYRKLGSSNSQVFNGRILLATNKNIEQMVYNGEFRSDLYDRINFFTYEIPTLRQDKRLVFEFIDGYQKSIDFPVIFNAQVENFFRQYHWPGNIRELKYMMDYFVIMKFDRIIQMIDLPQKYLKLSKESLSSISDYRNICDQFDQKVVLRFLKKYDYKINQTTREMGISKNTLLSKIKKYNINVMKLKSLAIS